MPIETPQAMSIEDRVRQFILENYLFTDDQEVLTNNDSFMTKGILDSTGIMDLVLFLEESFGLAIDAGEMVPENLDCVDHVVAFVQRKQAA